MKMQKYYATILVFTGMLLSGFAFSADKVGTGERALGKTTVLSAINFDGNRIDNDLMNNGMIVSQLVSGRSGMSWPKGNGTQTIYASGIWLGGKVDGQIRVVAGEFAGEFAGGPWGSDPSDSYHKLYKVSKSDLADPLASDDFQNWPAHLGAPFVDNNGNGTYEPLPKGPDMPEFIGDQVIWAVMNDGDVTMHSVFQSAPMGLEVQMTVFGFDRPDVFGDMMFVKKLIINRGNNTIKDMIVGLWSDPDLGDASDDFVGCDTTLGMGICYNDGVDAAFAGYSGGTPAVGYDFFQGPMVPSPGDTAYMFDREIPDMRNLKMTSFTKYINGDPTYFDPRDAEEAYNYMSGFMPDGSDFPFVASGGTKFVHPGDPTLDTGPGDTEYVDADLHASDDRRFLMNAGPFVMAPGDSQEVVFGIINVAAGGALDSYLYLKEVDKLAQLAYDIHFALPPSPPKPEVEVTIFKNEIILSWDNSAESYIANDQIDKHPETGEDTEFVFEGYNVYQVETASGSGTIKRIATYDIINGITEIYDDVFSTDYGLSVNVITRYGSDSGLKRSISIVKDAINEGAELIPNRVYYFSVNAYGYNPYGIPKTLESPFKIIAVRPHSPSTWEATDNTAVSGQLFPAVHVGPAAGSADVVIVNPMEVTGDDYEVSFKTVEGTIVWDLTNVSTGVKLIDGNPVQGGVNMATGEDVGVNDLPIVEGIQVQINGPAAGIDPNRIGIAYGEGSATSEANLKGWDFAGTRWVGGVAAGYVGFFGGLGNSFDFWGTSLTSGGQYVDVLMEWAGCDNCTEGMTVEEMVAQSKIDYPDRWSLAVSQDLAAGYAQQLNDVPWKAYDIDATPRRQLKCGMLEDGSNGIWDMGWDPVAGAFAPGGNLEIIWILNEDYDEEYTEYLNWNRDISGWGNTSPNMYVIRPQARGTHPYLEAPWEFMVFAARVNTENDTYTFSTSGLEGNTVEYNLDDINVWPNPYFAFNPEERDPVDQQIHFINLPESGKCTIRIFDLAGVPVKTLNHDDGTTVEIWNVKNNSNIPVASGMYIVIIETEKGDKLLKIAVIQPEQRLDIHG